MEKYKISVIIPIYNVEDYIEETIESVISQTIGFEENIQMILVNDGSPDNSETICLKYRDKYPNNILYIKQENSGVSAARNNGVKHATGKYVTFLDSDDKWEIHSFENVWKFFEANSESIDVVAARIKFFEGSDKYHPLDFKFTGNFVVDVTDKYNFIQLMGNSVFSKTEIAQKNLFNQNLKYGEDAYWVNTMILEKQKYGVVSDALYLYRKRISNSSAQDKAIHRREYYLDTVDMYLSKLYLDAEKHNKKCLKYVESVILYELYWKINIVVPNDVMTEKELKEYIDKITKLVKKIDDDVIVNNLTFGLIYKLYFFKLKYGSKFYKRIEFLDDGVKFNNLYMENNFSKVKYTKFRVDSKNNLIIHGEFCPIINEFEYELFAKDMLTNKKIVAKLFNVNNRFKYSYNGDVISKPVIFRMVLPLRKNKYELSNFIKYDKSVQSVNCSFNRQNKLSNKYKDFRIIDKKCIISRLDNKIIVTKYSPLIAAKFRIGRLLDLLLKLKVKTFVKLCLSSAKSLLLKFNRIKNIIILESNPDFSDNSKFVFDMLIKQKFNEKYKIVWFVNDSKQFENIKIKNVEFLDFFGIASKNRSKKVNYYYKHAKIILDSNKYIKKANPKQIRIHLNHGSPFKNALHYNINLGDVDYEIVQSKFFMKTESDVRDIDINKIVPLGFPRNDVLYEDNADFSLDIIDNLTTKKTILWLPTYRSHFKFSGHKNNLKYGLPCINNKDELLELNKKLQIEGITLLIKFHPVEKVDLIESYNLSNILIIKDEDLKNAGVTLYKLFTKVDALITDYSSVYFDFCLTKKNIGLAISDIDEYVEHQGEFQYKYKDAMIGNYMYNNKDLLEFVDDVAKGKDKTYKKRMKLVKRYDDYQDGKSTERVYEFIKKFL